MNHIRKLGPVAALVLILLLLGGCVTPPPRTHGTKWVCTGKCDIPPHQASAKCTAQANAVANADLRMKRNIRDDCVAGEGWELTRCNLANDDPDCQ